MTVIIDVLSGNTDYCDSKIDYNLKEQHIKTLADKYGWSDIQMKNHYNSSGLSLIAFELKYLKR